jgi:hypothetical protein
MSYRRSTSIYDFDKNTSYAQLSVFGPVEIKKGTANIKGKDYDVVKYDIDTGNIENYLAREFGQTKNLLRNARYRQGLSNPEAYLEERDEEEMAIIPLCAKEYKRAYKNHYSRGYTNKECEEKALRAAKNYYNMKMEEIRSDFPSDVSSKLIKKLSDKAKVK